MPSVDTDLLHLDEDPRRNRGAINTPVYRASLFGFDVYEEFLSAMEPGSDEPIYSRNSNPTRDTLEAKLAYLERADHAIAFSSGMGAISAALLGCLRAGDHLLVVSCVYGPTRVFCDTLLARLGVEVEYFPSAESANLRPRLKPNTRLILLESPGTGTFEVQDIRAVTELARGRGILTVVDNSWATPLFLQPLALGVDMVVHSATKYIAGHADVMAGVLACNAELYKTIKPVATILGASLSPDDAYLVMRGLRTLPVRMARHQESGLAIARWLQERPEVLEVRHPGLPEFPGYELARSQMSGYSSLFAVKLHPAPNAARHAFVDALRYFTIGFSWGGFESLILPLGGKRKDAPDADEGDPREEVYRLCVGLEGVDDLIDDLERGFAARAAASAQPA